jgi:hypothetical protein
MRDEEINLEFNATYSKASINPPTPACGPMGSGLLCGHPEMGSPVTADPMQNVSNEPGLIIEFETFLPQSMDKHICEYLDIYTA